MPTLSELDSGCNILASILDRTRARRTGRDKWQGHCPNPVHHRGDRNPSLSIALGKDATILIYCHSCHDTAAVCRALDVRLGRAGLRRPRPQAQVSDPKVELRRVIRRVAQAVIEGPVPATDAEGRLRQQHREARDLYLCLSYLIDQLAGAPVVNEEVLEEAIDLHTELERELDALDAALNGRKGFLHDAMKRAQR